MIEYKTYIANKIWLTSKVRMVAESKRRTMNTILWILGFYYSIASLSVHLFRVFHGSYSSEVGAFFSMIGLFAPYISLGLGLIKSSDEYRKCYLNLQKLLDNPSPSISKKYSDILDDSPNHNSYDYIDFVVKHAWIEMKTLTDGTSKNVEATTMMIVTWGFRRFFLWFFIVLFFSPPLVYWWFCFFY
ncbi:SLATT domain-containing protein [Candidatus Liberibacter africanus]|uniref:SMODS and SLOG-associating 2TM effector domain-containing protein n=1 Tax=Candidatus Liberibacter africanus PTSAPSY TaxID=1277257 RepID=A0A0G3I5S3_LIBAF|nr:SLATT domain-containing protein [Candidatus Liberibacter africanus]AKK20615.1 hypothetical protein G293_05000 [Candidatus Liberibacter africanus PTSAPSY]QTP64297.1 SLATT domain-containing protein [Candidatus Liberibacter africanus]